MHFAVAHAAAALAAFGIDHNLAARFSRGRLELQRSVLQLKRSLHGVKNVAQSELDGGLRGIELECRILSRGRDGQRRSVESKSPIQSRRQRRQLDALCASDSWRYAVNSPHPRVRPSNCQVQGRQHAHVQFQQSPENVGAFLEGLQRAPLQPGTSIKREHQSGHQERPQSKPTMFVLVTSQISSPHAIRQHHRLAERETESLARDGIDCAGRIPDQTQDFRGSRASACRWRSTRLSRRKTTVGSVAAATAIRGIAAAPRSAAIWHREKSAPRRLHRLQPE